MIEIGLGICNSPPNTEVDFLVPTNAELCRRGHVVAGTWSSFHGREIPAGCYTCTVQEIRKGETKLPVPCHDTDPPQVHLKDAANGIVMCRGNRLCLANK